jgi:hypothetical protein
MDVAKLIQRQLSFFIVMGLIDLSQGVKTALVITREK